MQQDLDFKIALGPSTDPNANVSLISLFAYFLTILNI